MPVTPSHDIPPFLEHGTLAAARIKDLTTAAELQTATAALGFQAVGPDQYLHDDGSWVALSATGHVERGFLKARFTSRPADIHSLPQRPPEAAAGTAAVSLPALHPGDPALPALLIARGFAEIFWPDLGIKPDGGLFVRDGRTAGRPAVYSHPDGSWVVIAGNQALRGNGLLRIEDTAPQPPALAVDPTQPAAPAVAPPQPTAPRFTAAQAAAFPAIAPTFEDGFLACAQLPFLQAAKIIAERSTLTRHGFTESSPGYFEHCDGSWVAYGTSRVERGKGQQRFNGVPGSRGGSIRDRGVTLDDLFLDTADRALSNLTVDTVGQAARDAGFQQINPNFWRAADGSFVAILDGAVRFGNHQELFRVQPDFAALATFAMTLDETVTAAPLWGLPSTAAAARPWLEQHGFAPHGFHTALYTQGSVWVALVDDKIELGRANHRYDVIPTPTSLATIPSDVQHRWMAIAQTRDLRIDDPGLDQALTQLGFVAKAQGVYRHGDGSFVASFNGALLRGAGNDLLADLPAAPKPGEYPQYAQLPHPNDWPRWRTQFAIGKVPRADGGGEGRTFTQEQLERILQYLGFTSVGGNGWTHPDGSQVTASGGRLSGSRFQKWGFGEFPYTVSPHNAQWVTDGVAWQRWLTGRGEPPFPKAP